jgi:hypothetical protein
MTVFLRAADAGKLAMGDEARIILDAAPDYVVPAMVGFVASGAPAAPKAVETQDDLAKLMLRVDLKIDPKVVETYYGKVETGLRGAGFVRTRPDAKWPAELQVKLPPAPIAQEPKPTPAPVAEAGTTVSAPVGGGASTPSAPAAASISAAAHAPSAEAPTSELATQTAHAVAPASLPSPAPVAEAAGPITPLPAPAPSSQPTSAPAPAPLPAPSAEALRAPPPAPEAKLAPPPAALSAPLAPAPPHAPAAHASMSAKRAGSPVLSSLPRAWLSWRGRGPSPPRTAASFSDDAEAL